MRIADYSRTLPYHGGRSVNSHCIVHEPTMPFTTRRRCVRPSYGARCARWPMCWGGWR